MAAEWPSTYKDSSPPPPRFPKTHKLTDSELEEHVLGLREQIRSLEGDAQAGQSDLFERRLLAIKEGREVSAAAPLCGLPNWAAQLRHEQVAHSNRAIDEQTARKVPGYKAPGS